MSESVKRYLEAAHKSPVHNDELRAAHGRGKADESFGAIVSHAARLGFHFTRDELIHFVTGGNVAKGSAGKS